MTFTTVRECPSAEKAWQQRAKKCTMSDHYHCLLNENSMAVEGCVNPIWVEPGNCPVYNSKAFKLDAQKCRTQVCPNGVYRSNNLFQYDGCFTPKRTSEAPVSLNVDESMEQNKTTPYVPSRPGTSSTVTAVVIPIILILVLLGVIAAAFVWYKRKRCRDLHASNSEKEPRNNRLRIWRIFNCSCQPASCSDKESRNRLIIWRIFTCSCRQKNNPQQQTEDEERLEQKKKLLCADRATSNDDKQTDNPENFTHAELLTEMNIKVEEICLEAGHLSPFAISLLNNNTLAMIGRWGSGKRRLAVQTALELEKVVNEKVQFKVFHYFDEMCEPSISGLSQPTVILLPDLQKFWCTDQHVEDVKSSLIRLRSIAKNKKLYIIASFTENAWTLFTSFFPNKNADSLFPEGMHINISSKTLSEIGEKNQFPLNETKISEILRVSSVLGTPLITMLYCKNPINRNSIFLKDPLTFILSDLRAMRDSPEVDNRMNFRVLEYTMLQGGNVEEEELENNTDHPLFQEMNNAKDKRDYIKSCISQLLNRYMEKTSVGNSYRMLHDVITKCVFLVAAEKEQVLTFKECDFFLLLDCIRLKSKTEKFLERGKLIFDYNALNIGIPTESFPMVAQNFKQRNENMAILRKVKLFSDKDFQNVWNHV